MLWKNYINDKPWHHILCSWQQDKNCSQFQCKIQLAVYTFLFHFKFNFLLFLADRLLICQKQCGIILSELVNSKVCKATWPQVDHQNILEGYCNISLSIASFKLIKSFSVLYCAALHNDVSLDRPMCMHFFQSCSQMSLSVLILRDNATVLAMFLCKLVTWQVCL